MENQLLSAEELARVIKKAKTETERDDLKDLIKKIDTILKRQ
jgi:hypothetical protein